MHGPKGVGLQLGAQGGGEPEVNNNEGNRSDEGGSGNAQGACGVSTAKSHTCPLEVLVDLPPHEPTLQDSSGFSSPADIIETSSTMRSCSGAEGWVDGDYISSPRSQQDS